MNNNTLTFENALILRTVNMSLGSIETNIDEVLESVKEKSRQYQDVAKYGGDDKQAKEDRALLRKQKDMTKTTVASIQRIWNKPLEQFISGGKEILKQFDFAIETIDEWVKEGEAVLKGKKREEIQAYFNTKNFDLVPLKKIFNDKWLNKGFSISDIKKEIDSTLSVIYSNIKVLENIADHGTTAKAFYLESLDMGEAMRQVETLKANAEKLAKEKVDREDREQQEQISRNIAEERREVYQEAREERTRSLVDEALDFEELKAPTTELVEYTMRFRGTKQQLLDLREYMTTHGIAYEKIV